MKAVESPNSGWRVVGDIQARDSCGRAAPERAHQGCIVLRDPEGRGKSLYSIWDNFYLKLRAYTTLPNKVKFTPVLAMTVCMTVLFSGNDLQLINSAKT